MKTKENYSKRKVVNLLKKLYWIMDNKTKLEVHNKVGWGSSGFTNKEERQLIEFDIKKFIAKHIK